MAKELEETLSHATEAQEARRRSSIAASLGGGFQTINVVKPLPTVTQSHEPQSGSTTFASKDLIAYYRPGSHWEGIHRYDENFTWESSEERHLVRKVRYKSLTVLQGQHANFWSRSIGEFAPLPVLCSSRFSLTGKIIPMSMANSAAPQGG